MSKKLGIYIHVPFCISKCPYCDFYSLKTDSELISEYEKALISSISKCETNGSAETVYFGGGTPNLLGEKTVLRILEAVNRKFPIENGAEITTEVNPGDDLSVFLKEINKGGINRLSIGMQSGNETELKKLGRRHTFEDVRKTAEDARKAGFDNFSLDLMLAIPGQTPESLINSAEKCAFLGAKHISAYILKIEEGTPFYNMGKKLSTPGDDASADFYILACKTLEELGYRQYEISNFSKPGYESRHNLKYWQSEEYLGFGPAAHSFINGRRFFYERSLEKFINGIPPIEDGEGGDIEEYCMLALRLREGIHKTLITDKYGKSGEKQFYKMLCNAKKYEKTGLVNTNEEAISFTTKGFLVSNSLICEIV